MSRLLFAVLLTICLGATTQVSGAVISVLGDTADGTVTFDGFAGDFSLPMIRAGVAGNDVSGQATIFFFALPRLPSRSSLVGAELDLQYLGISQFTVTVPPEFNGDLFGIGARSTPTILASDYYDGDASLSADSLIAEAFVTPTSVPSSLQDSSSNLLNFLASLYQSDGTPTAAFAVFRVNPDVDLPPFSTPYRGYELASADNTDNGGTFVPRLSVTVVPEPSTLVMFLGNVAILAVYGLRNRKARAQCIREIALN
jgi:hypothetical protein